MKLSTILSLALLAVSAAPTVALAFPGADEMAANFAICNRSDESWYRRFGQYIVAFDLGDAVKACNAQTFGPQRPHLAGCNTEAGNLWAGYYCEEIDGGAKGSDVQAQ